MCVGELQAVFISTAELRRFVVFAAAPNRADGMNDMVRWQTEAGGDNRFACEHWSVLLNDILAGCLKFNKTGGSVNSAVHTTTSGQPVVGGIDNGIDGKSGYVALANNEPPGGNVPGLHDSSEDKTASDKGKAVRTDCPVFFVICCLFITSNGFQRIERRGMSLNMSHREKILIVDDQPENIDIMVEALQSTYDLMAATNGEAALERARGESPPDLVLLDVMMPGMDGYEVCRRLKEGRTTRDIPIIFVTALNDADKEAKGFDLGAVDYITKPISPPVVMARVRAHLQLIHARRVLMRQNDVLEQRVKERTAEVVRAQVERLEGLNNFANAMAHQIRNPVMALGGMSGLLLKKVPPNSPLSEYAVAVRENSLRLEHLVGVISDYVSLTVGKTAAFPVRSLVDDAIEQAREIATDRGKDLDCRAELADGNVVVDAELAVVALVEIMQNAIEFCESSTVVLSIQGGPDVFPLEVTATERFYAADRQYGLRITDSGPGIPEENLAFVTDPFFTTKASGVGLGLTRAKRILHDELGGELSVESPPNEGVSVTVGFVSEFETN